MCADEYDCRRYHLRHNDRDDPAAAWIKDQAVLEAESRDLLKTLSQLLSDYGAETPFLLLEMLVAAMFVVEEAYTATKGDPRSARFVFDGFRAELITFAAYEYYFTQRTHANLEDLFAFSDQFHTLRHARYAEYGAMCGTRGKSACLTGTARALLAHLASRGLPGHMVDRILVPLRDHLAAAYAACTRSLWSQVRVGGA